MCYTFAEMIYIIHTFWGAEGGGQRAEGREQGTEGKRDHFVCLQMFYKNLIYFFKP